MSRLRQRLSWRSGCVLLLIGAGLACGGLFVLLPRTNPGEFIYPGAVPVRTPDPALLGLYGVYATADPVDRVADWYTRQGLLGTHELIAGSIPSATGGSGGTARVPMPATHAGLRLGRELHYLAIDRGGTTIINLWCMPLCRPDDPFWAGVQLVP